MQEDEVAESSERLSVGEDFEYLVRLLPEGWQAKAKELGALRRWQIELVFKRLKSILQLGHLRKIDPDSTRSWIEGKLFVALLLESLLHQAESFFPWGFPLDSSPPLPLA